MDRRLPALCLLVALAGVSGCTTEPEIADENLVVTEQPLFAEWDANDNGVLELEEFAQEVERVFYDWDLDADGVLDEQEFEAAFNEADFVFETPVTFARWDDDEDADLSEEEFVTGMFDAWDVDDDGAIEEAEFGWSVEEV